MFKAQILKDVNKYRSSKGRMVQVILVSVVVGVVVNFSDFSFGTSLFIVAVYVGMLMALFLTAKSAKASISAKQLHISADKIRVVDIDNTVLEEYAVAELDEITVREKYVLQPSGVAGIIDELKGPRGENVISFVYRGQAIRLPFLLDTSFMANKLNEIVAHWSSTNKELRLG